MSKSFRSLHRKINSATEINIKIDMQVKFEKIAIKVSLLKIAKNMQIASDTQIAFDGASKTLVFAQKSGINILLSFPSPSMNFVADMIDKNPVLNMMKIPATKTKDAI